MMSNPFTSHISYSFLNQSLCFSCLLPLSDSVFTHIPISLYGPLLFCFSSSYFILLDFPFYFFNLSLNQELNHYLLRSSFSLSFVPISSWKQQNPSPVIQPHLNFSELLSCSVYFMFLLLGFHSTWYSLCTF